MYTARTIEGVNLLKMSLFPIIPKIKEATYKNRLNITLKFLGPRKDAPNKKLNFGLFMA